MTNERARTSETHPIRVDFFDRETLDLPGRLGMTFLPGMKGASARGGPWERDLDSDLRRLKEHYGVAALVSLLRDEEFEEYGVPDLLAVAEREGMSVLHFPITDVSVPEEAEDDAYAALIEEILGLLERGENVVAHCRGGLGRTGVVAASVLVASGYGADEAIGRTRRARRDTVETAGQEDYVRRFEGRWRDRGRSGGSGGSGGEEPTQVQRYRGSLLGLAAGDALGTTVEFSPPGTSPAILLSICAHTGTLLTIYGRINYRFRVGVELVPFCAWGLTPEFGRRVPSRCRPRARFGEGAATRQRKTCRRRVGTHR